ncbi:MAG: gliding motility-associated C-terminal domain-containing protein [Saprospiraceae bacterium]|nr:gliding motility-associated C-terminal domain-containing protein [Saprospiraceae bacterium]
MRKFYSKPIFTVLLCAFFFTHLSAQNNNLKVAFKDAASAPRNLNVCGDEATVTMSVSTDGSLSAVRRNILANLRLFKGVQFVRFNAAGTSAGVTMATSNAGGASFTLPDLTPLSSTSSVNISYVIRVNCEYTDTLSRNDLLEVQDRWDFSYNIGTSSNVTETDLSTPYRDQIKVPFFTMSLSNNATAARVGQCFQRTIYINNSGLDGYVKNFEYKNTQGAGISLQSMTINGQSVTMTKTPVFNFAGDTTITVNVPSSLFVFNTKGPTIPADGDQLFEPDETVTIVETFCVMNCDKSRTSTHAMSWGCDARFCNTLTRQDLIRLGEGQVNVGFVGVGSVPDVTGGYCRTGRSTVKFSNNGIEVDPGTAGMYDLQLGVGLGDSILLRDKGYHITKVVIAGVTMPTPSVALADLRNNPLFRTDPDGAGVGLADTDGDGYFDDLPLGKSVEITIEYEVECSASLTNRDDNCKNDFETAFNAQLNYTDLCGRRNQIIKPRYFAPLNVNDLVENCTDPDCHTDEQPFTIQHMERRNIFNFDRDCNGQEEILVKVKMPQGILAIKDSMYMLRFTDTMFLRRMSISGDTLYMAFRLDSVKQKGSAGEMIAVDYINGDFKVNMGFKATCAAVPGPTNFPMEMAFSCPPCGCQHVWYCDTLAGPRVHYDKLACGPNPAYDCPKGLATTDFTAIRTTLGYTDATYRTHISPQNANLKVAMSCDSVRMTVLNVVGSAPLSDSIGVRISYDNITNLAQTHLNDIFQYGKGYVRFVKNGQSYTCPVDTSKIRVVRTDSSKYIYVDLHSCLTSLNIGPLSMGDSVNFYGDFSVFTDGPYKNTFEKIPQFRAYGYHIDGGQEFACDNFGETFRVGKSQSVFSFPNSSSYPKGCTEANLEYKIIMINNGYYDHFGNEYRQSVGVDSFTLQFDPEFIRAFTTKVDVSIPDHPFAGGNFYPLSNLDSTGKFVARFDTLRIVPSLNRVTSYAFNLRIKATPNCRSLTGSSLNNNNFAFKPKIFYRDRYYAVEIGDGSCAPYRRDSVLNGNIVYSDPPALTFVPTTNPSVSTANDTAVWTVKQCNTSNKGGAGTTWVSVEPHPSVQDFRVVSMRDITNNQNQFALTFNTYGTNGRNTFAYTNPLTVATPEKNLDDICNVVEIKAVIGDCGESHVDINSGWNCVKPTQTDWNPTLYPPCTDLTVEGIVTTEAPFLDANFINQSLNKPGICDSTVFEILLRNTDLGTVYDVRTRIILPLLGATYIPDRVEVAYPSSAPYHPAAGVPTVVGLNERGRIFQYADFSKLDNYLHQHGLKGFDPNRPNDSNEVKIRFRFANDCDFKSGSLLYYSFLGKSSCGTLSNNETGESLPIDIEGADLTVPKLYAVGINNANHFVPGGESTLEVNFTNLTSTPSDSSDEVSVKLPSGIRYKPNSSVGVLPAGWTPNEPRLKLVGDIQVVTWYQPRGLQLNQQGVLHFTVITPDTLSCDGGTRTIGVSTMAEKELVCTTSQSVCRIEVITTSDGEQYYNLPLSTDSLTITTVPLLNAGVIRVRRGETVVLTASGTSIRWIDVATSAVLSTNQSLSYIPTRSETIIRAESTSGNCLAPAMVRILTEQDSAAPRITVRDTTIGCRDSFPLILPIVTDDFDPNPSVTYRDSLVQLQPCGDRLYRIWTATDASGKTAVATQVITRMDSTPPVISLKNQQLLSLNFHNGDTLTVDCQHIPLFNALDVDVADDCDPNSTRSFVDLAVRFGQCQRDGYLVLMDCQWKATDKCGNMSTFKIYVKVIDNDMPRVVNLPPDITVNSLSEVPVRPTNVYGQDDCDDQVSIQFKETNQGDTLIIRTWILTDDCGHTSTGKQYITIRNNGTIPRDTTPPQYQLNNALFANNLANGGTVNYNGCNYSLKINDLRVTDNRDPNPRVVLDSVVQNGNCLTDGYIALKIYTWTATDSSGNQATFRINLRVKDETVPVITGDLIDMTLAADDAFPPIPTVQATDNCSIPTLNMAMTESVEGNDTVYVRTWTATDACGNTATAKQTITRKGIGILVPDLTPPQFEPSNALLRSNRRSGDTIQYNGCDYAFVITDMHVTDNRDRNPQVRLDSIIILGNCRLEGYLSMKKYTWTARDSSGNTATYKINLRIYDSIAPVMSNLPANVTIAATDVFPAEPPINVSDNCSTPTVQMVMNQSIVAPDTVYTRRWIVIDGCGNTSTAEQTIKRLVAVQIPRDTTPPQYAMVHPALSGARSGDTIYSIVCGMSLDRNSVSVSDNRDPNPVVQFDSTVRNGICVVDGYLSFKTYTWTARDSAGNQSFFKVYLKVADATPPQINDVPADVTINSTDNLPTANVTTTDDCTNPLLTLDLTVIQSGNDTLFVRTWTAIDECGNATVARQNIYKRGATNSHSSGSIVDNKVMEISENQSDTICFKNTNRDSTYTVINICPDSTNGSATFTLLGNGSCVVIRGISPGVSKACFQVCDGKGRCDTTYIKVIILAKSILKPVLTEDYAVTRKNKSIEIPVSQNDVISGNVVSFDIKYQPRHGEAATRIAGSEYLVIYVPNDEFCSTTRRDELVYEVCNQVGCAQTLVHIGVLCEGLVIRNGFSPNGDGKNDFFIIENLADYPNTQVSIYNRWGNQVFLSKDYKNDWTGDYNGSLLPDGTYFYQVLLENGESFTGFLQIQR